MMTDQERMDPRFDPAFQRGFAGGVERLRSDERAFARPASVVSSAAPSAAGAASLRASGLEEIATPRRARRAAPEAPPARLPSGAERVPVEPVRLPSDSEAPGEPSAEFRQSAPVAEPLREAPLLRNPWLLALLLAGLAGTVLGFTLLYTGYSSPPASYYGDTDTPSPAWIQRQILYYASIPLLGSLPFALLLAMGVAALRWRGRAAPVESDRGRPDDEATAVTVGS